MKTRYQVLIALGIISLGAAVGPIITRLRDLGDVKLATTPTTGQALVWDGTRWTNANAVSSATNGTIIATNITVISTITVVSNNFTVGKGGHLTISNSFTIVTNAVMTFSNMPWPSVMIVGSDGNLTNAVLSGLTLSGNTLTASGGSSSPWRPNTALSYVGGGTNVALPGGGGTNYYLTVTKSTWFTTPTEIPASGSTNTEFTVFFKMDGTGTWPVGWTNDFKFPGGPTAKFQPDTNANAVSWVTFTFSPFTNGIFMADYGVLGNQ